MIDSKYRYYLFGILIESDLEISFLDKVSDYSRKTDLSFSLNSSFVHPSDLKAKRTIFGPDYLYYMDNKEVIFKISKKGIIEFKKSKNLSPIELATSLLSIPLGYFFFLKKEYVFHASAISKKNNATCFLGHSAMGKSSISNFFLSHNYKFISEDLCIVDKNQKIAKSSNWIKLSDELIKKTKSNFSSFLPLKNDSRSRKVCKLKDDFISKSNARVKACYIPAWDNELKISRLENKEAFKYLFLNSYRAINTNKKLPIYEKIFLENITNFIENVDCFLFKRKKDMKFFEKSNEYLLNHMESNAKF